MPRTAEIFGSAIIAIGAFNPAIYSPDWLERNNLFGADDAKIAREDPSIAITSQFAKFEVEWTAVQVLQNQLSISSKGALSPAIKDLALGILTLLPHTPIQAIGLNFYGHYKLPTESDYYKIGDTLAPKEIWKELFPDPKVSAGLGDLTIRIQKTENGRIPITKDEKRIRLQPSDSIKFGVALSYNDHSELTEDRLRDKTSAECAAQIVAADWQASWDDALQIFDSLIEKSTK